MGCDVWPGPAEREKCKRCGSEREINPFDLFGRTISGIQKICLECFENWAWRFSKNEKRQGKEFKLCYVEGQWAYFTTQELSEQWGDDWNDAPYEHNAGQPYDWQPNDKKKEPWKIMKLAWDGPFETPSSEVANSSYSVEMINAMATPWLTRSRYRPELPMVRIMAGSTPEEFKDQVSLAGGHVYEMTAGTKV